MRHQISPTLPNLAGRYQISYHFVQHFHQNSVARVSLSCFSHSETRTKFHTSVHNRHPLVKQNRTLSASQNTPPSDLAVSELIIKSWIQALLTALTLRTSSSHLGASHAARQRDVINATRGAGTRVTHSPGTRRIHPPNVTTKVAMNNRNTRESVGRSLTHQHDQRKKRLACIQYDPAQEGSVLVHNATQWRLTVTVIANWRFTVRSAFPSCPVK